MISLTKPDIQAYIGRLTAETGCTNYLYSPTPLRIRETLFDRLNAAVPAMLDLLDTPEYFLHCQSNGNWTLPSRPLKETDYTGCADFLLTDHGAKLIEMNINLPGKIGLMQTLAETARTFLGEPESQFTNLDFNTRLATTIRKALPNSRNIAVVVSHLPASAGHQAHYRWFAGQLQQNGLSATVVQANDIRPSSKGCVANGITYDGMINLVIPFVWEMQQEAFLSWTAVLKQHPDRIFPHPAGGMYGTKDLLAYLDRQRGTANAVLWSDFVLRAAPFTDFETADQLLERFLPVKSVLKPMKDYDTKGVYVQPGEEIVRRLFNTRREHYMVQEFTKSKHLLVQLPDESTAVTHSAIYRIFFAEKQPIGYQAYFICRTFNGEYYTAPVVID